MAVTINGTDGIETNTDTGKVKVGASDDLQISHDGTDSFIANTTGSLTIKNTGNINLYTNNNKDAVVCTANGAVEIYYNGTKKISTDADGIWVSGALRGESVDLANSKKVLLGSADDFEIFHDGSDAYISNTTNTDLIIRNLGNAGIQVKPQNSYPVELYFNNGKKFATRADGTSAWGNSYIYAAEAASAGLYLVADEGDDNADYWRIVSNQDNNDLTIANFAEGSYTDKLTIDSGGEVYFGRDSNITITGDQTDHTFEQLSNNKYALGLNCNQTNKRGLGIYYTGSSGASDAIRFAVSSAAKFIVEGSGDTKNANNSFGSISDASLKENIVDANSQWNDIKNIKIRNFNFKASTGQDTHKQIGVVAQELETVCPKLVDTGEDGIKTVASSVLYMKAVKALQEAMAKIETLETEVNTLKTKVAALEAA